MPRKTDINTIDLKIDGILFSERGIRVKWSSNIGYGSYDIIVEDGSISGHSETMDSNEDKDFLKKIFELIVNQIQIKS